MLRFLRIFRRLGSSRAARNAGASYLAFVSTSLCALVSIPITVHYLDKEQIGLWTIVYTIVNYLMWMDFGVGDATGRKIADSIAVRDQAEMNRWWTASLTILVLLGAIMIGLALTLSPFLPQLLNVKGSLVGDALWLFWGAAIVAGVGMPFRAYPGILLAQERFHWVPLVQALIPWIQVGCFVWLLHHGQGIRSYFWSLSLSQVMGWAVFVYQVHSGPDRFRMDFRGLTRVRLHSLFSYSGSIALTGISATILNSLPSMMLARMGGLGIVPVYNFSNRGPGMLNNLVGRTSHAFYPNLQKLHITGERDRFRAKYREVNQLAVAISLIAAGAVLAGNRSLITWLAGAGFYAGAWTNTWFAVGVIILPLIGGFMNLLQFSGAMGKVAWMTVAQVGFGVGLGWLGYRWFALPGLAAAFVVLPAILQGPYALIRGARNCGFQPLDLSRNAMTTAALAVMAVLLAGGLIAHDTTIPTPITLFTRVTSLPTLLEWIVGFSFALPGCLLAFHHLKRIKNA